MPGTPTAAEALGDAFEALDKLERLCCEPGRSPRMAEIRETLIAIEALGVDDPDPDGVDAIMEHLEVGGARIGALQVGCCAPGRLPLYQRLLERLTQVQLDVNQALGRGH